MATASQVTSFFNEMGRLCVSESNNRIAGGQGYILPSVAMAQAALETGYGTSSLMTKANAYFGIKAGSSWTGKVYSASTREVYNGVSEVTEAVFRAYSTKAESVYDYYELLLNSSRYSGAVSYFPADILSPYWTIYNIWDGGYATDPDYVSKIMSIINRYNLTEWDVLITGDSTTPSDIHKEYEGTGSGEILDTITGTLATDRIYLNSYESSLDSDVLRNLIVEKEKSLI